MLCTQPFLPCHLIELIILIRYRGIVIYQTLHGGFRFRTIDELEVMQKEMEERERTAKSLRDAEVNSIDKKESSEQVEEVMTVKV